MSNSPQPASFASPFIMFLSAAIFGYFGFGMGLSHQTAGGQFVLFFALLDWTLKGSAIGFAIAGAVTLAAPFAGNLIYSLTSVIGALLFIAVGVMDHMDKTNAAAIPPFLLLIFAAWNGYGGWAGLQAILARREQSGEVLER